jgi:hypothetical protein
MTTAAWVLIVWAVAADGLPTLPIAMTPGLTFEACTKGAWAARKHPGMHAVCRPMVFVKA